MIDYSLYLVTDDPSRYSGNWLDKVVAAVEGGVTCVQYRDTESDRETQYRRILALRDALHGHSTPIIVNNDAYLAAAVKAEGVHVGQNDMEPGAVRAIVGPNCEIGLSITNFDQAKASLAFAGTVDAVGIGPVFDARKTKKDASEAIGIEGLAEIIQFYNSQFSILNSQFSTVAIGGITSENAAEVLATGVDGLAVVSVFSQSEDAYDRAKDFSMLFDHRRK